jgi:hypothetical protein
LSTAKWVPGLYAATEDLIAVIRTKAAANSCHPERMLVILNEVKNFGSCYGIGLLRLRPQDDQAFASRSPWRASSGAQKGPSRNKSHIGVFGEHDAVSSRVAQPSRG